MCCMPATALERTHALHVDQVTHTHWIFLGGQLPFLIRFLRVWGRLEKARQKGDTTPHATAYLHVLSVERNASA